MGYQPVCIDGVSGVAAAQMVINSAFRHLSEGGGDRFQKGLGVGGNGGVPECFEDPGLGKLGRAAYAAALFVHDGFQAAGDVACEIMRG